MTHPLLINYLKNLAQYSNLQQKLYQQMEFGEFKNQPTMSLPQGCVSGFGRVFTPTLTLPQRGRVEGGKTYVAKVLGHTPAKSKNAKLQ